MRTALACIALLLGFYCSQGQRPPLTLPDPPRPRQPWRADANVPTNILSAVETLFEQGFPDPRGCEYREIEVNVSGVWGGKTAHVKTHGWVLPRDSRRTNQFAICWNGLVYPVTSVGAAVDLHGDVANAGPVPGRRFNSGVGETRTVVYDNASATRLLLLLRCGETESALRGWSPNAGMNGNGTENNDPYLEFAGDWAWAMFDRTISAHMRGDEWLALATARQLAAVQPKIEAECARRRLPRGETLGANGRSQELPSYLTFLGQLPQLLADLERRAHEPVRVSVLETGLEKLPGQSARIAALIHDLDLVQARQWGQPGMVNLAEDPIVDALIHEGDAAVEPLLDCLEQDRRLTRSVGFARDFFRNRKVLGVSSAASVAIQTILQAGFRGGAPEMRVYWNKYKGLAIDERCYAILKDDSANDRWQEAATWITQPENQTRYPGGFSVVAPAPTNAPVRLRGESLRTKSNPSVSELMARRATTVPEANPNAYDLSWASSMAMHLAAWDSRAVRPVAKTLVRRCCTTMKYSNQSLGHDVAGLTVVLAEAGDDRPFDDYAEWLKSLTPDQMGNLFEDLAPLEKYPQNEALQAAAENLFNPTNPAWVDYPRKRIGPSNLLETGLVHVPAFRRLLAGKLDEKGICGSVEFRAPETVAFQIDHYMNGTRSGGFPEERRPPSGTKVDLRWCDWIAWSLSNAKAVSFFSPFDSVERRDEAIEKMKAELR